MKEKKMNKYALICEDSVTSAYCIDNMLKNLGYHTEIAATAKEAFELLSKNRYDLLTLDILLPDKNGLDFLREIQDIQILKDLPIIVISATKQENADLSFPNNIIYWLEKSFDTKSFEKAVESILKQKNNNKVEILHVENDIDLLTLVDVNLNDIANVTQINNLKEAKEIIETKIFDIIILDYVFPEGTSDKLIPAIKYGINKNAKLIVFSAYEENKILSQYVDEIIIKAKISFEQFKTCIEKFIT
jgi:CheY-like chemotaxis protein